MLTFMLKGFIIHGFLNMTFVTEQENNG